MQTLHATTPEQFQQVLANSPRVLVDFYKDQCPGCSMLALSLQKFAAQPEAAGLVLLKVRLEDVGEALFRSLGLRQTPTLCLYVEAVEQRRLAGFQSPAQITAAVSDSSAAVA